MCLELFQEHGQCSIVHLTEKWHVCWPGGIVEKYVDVSLFH